jgi:hypothetical protein
VLQPVRKHAKEIYVTNTGFVRSVSTYFEFQISKFLTAKL